jgi:hypothetical protein
MLLDLLFKYMFSLYSSIHFFNTTSLKKFDALRFLEQINAKITHVPYLLKVIHAN